MDNLNLIDLQKSVGQSLERTGYRNFIIAISGGADSLLLLTIINKLKDFYKFNIRAIHINHNIVDNSKIMEKRCVEICNSYEIEIIVKKLKTSKENNLEEYLRTKRYKFIFKNMHKDEALVLGHHLDDQIETFFYRLFRGSSPIGLSSMSEVSQREGRIICRPLLSFSKKTIMRIVNNNKIEYVYDPSNDNLNFDRNYIRNKIIPKVRDRWSGLDKVMIHNIKLQNTYKNIASDYVDMIYDHIAYKNKIDIKVLNNYPEYIHTIFIKHWISKTINYELNKNELANLCTLINNQSNDYPKLILKNDVSIIKYNNLLYIVGDDWKNDTPNKSWDVKDDVIFGNNKISIMKLKNKGIYENLTKRAPIMLKSVQGREKIKLNNDNHQDLKKLFQNKSIPIWERERFILLFSKDQLLVAYGDDHIFISSDLR